MVKTLQFHHGGAQVPSLTQELRPCQLHNMAGEVGGNDCLMFPLRRSVLLLLSLVKAALLIITTNEIAMLVTFLSCSVTYKDLSLTFFSSCFLVTVRLLFLTLR